MEEDVKKAIIEYRCMMSPVKPGDSVLEKIRNSAMNVGGKTLLGTWEAVEVTLRTKSRPNVAVVVKKDDSTIVIPAVKLDDLRGVRLRGNDPLNALITVLEHIGRKYHPSGVLTTPVLVNGQPVSVEFKEDGKVRLTSGRWSKTIPIERVGFPDDRVWVSKIDYLNRHVHKIPYLVLKSGVHRFIYDIQRQWSVEKLFPLFKAIKDGKVVVDVHGRETFSSLRHMSKNLNDVNTSGGTLIHEVGKVRVKKIVSFPDISAIWDAEGKLEGVIVDAYYRKLSTRYRIDEGVSGWFFKADGTVKRFSIKLGKDWTKAD